MEVWGEMAFGYTMAIAEGVRMILQALPKGVRRAKLNESVNTTPRWPYDLRIAGRVQDVKSVGILGE